jgi:hypothetical protein
MQAHKHGRVCSVCEENEILTNTPACGIKILPRRPNSQGNLLNLGREGGNARERHVEQAVVDLIGQDDNLVLEADIGDALQLLAGEDLADGVICSAC